MIVFKNNQRNDLDDVSYACHKHIHERIQPLTQHASLILGNNKMKSKKFDSFLKEKNIQNSQGSLLKYNFCHIFYQKDISVVSNVNVVANLTAFCSKVFIISHFLTIAYTRLICKQSLLYLIYANFMSIYQQVRQLEQRVRPVIHGSRVRIPAETILPFQCHVE